MKRETIEIRIEALTNASELIRSHVEIGLDSDELGGINVQDYQKQCKFVANMLTNQANKLRKKLKIKNNLLTKGHV